MSKKRILISINTSWNIYNFRRNLIQFLINQGFHVIALAPKDAYSEKLEVLGCEYHSLKMNQKGKNPLEDLKLYRDYVNYLKDLKPDICLFYTIKPNIYGSMAALRLGIPYINNISGLGTVFLRPSLSSTIAIQLYKSALKKSSMIFFQNSADLQVFLQKKIIKSQEHQVLAGSGIDTDYFSTKAKTQNKNEHVHFLMISRLIYDKGIREYLEAAVQILASRDDLKFEILGKDEADGKLGMSRTEIQSQIDQTGIIWHGEQEDVRTFIENADVIVLPSYREGMSRALLEACSMSKPIVASDVPGCRELVNNGETGILCEERNATSLKKSILEIASIGHNSRLKMGQKAREMVKANYSEHIIFKAYLNAITEKLN
jgi:glycosyltransferase involved in cell wall biosynthesis